MRLPTIGVFFNFCFNDTLILTIKMPGCIFSDKNIELHSTLSDDDDYDDN